MAPLSSWLPNETESETMERVWIRITLVALVIVAIGIPVGRMEAAKQYALAYKMDKGTEFTVQVTRKHRNQRNFMGNDLVTNTEELMEYEFTVKSSGDDGLRLELEYTEREYKADEGESSIIADMSELIGNRVKMLLSPTGVPSDFEDFDDLPEIRIPGQEDPLTELRYENEVMSLFPRLSPEAVAAGGSWSGIVQYDEPIGDVTLPIKMLYTYTLIEETKFGGLDCLKLEGEYTITLSGTIAASGLDLEMNVAGTGTDTIYFAWKKGMFLSSETRFNMKGSADNEEMGVSIPMEHDIETMTTVSLD